MDHVNSLISVTLNLRWPKMKRTADPPLPLCLALDSETNRKHFVDSFFGSLTASDYNFSAFKDAVEVASKTLPQRQKPQQSSPLWVSDPDVAAGCNELLQSILLPVPQ